MDRPFPPSRNECTMGEQFNSVPARGGVGLKPVHYRDILDRRPSTGFFEVHAENYMGGGGPPHRYLETIRRDYPLSLHGVGLSIGADRPLDREHLHRLRSLIDRYQPGLFSEHLAWSSHGDIFLNDLLPVPYTSETLARVTDHIDEVQDHLGLRILLENPSSYVAFSESSYDEPGFISEVQRRTGCGLLLDVSNVHVATINQNWNPITYIDSFPLRHVQEIHLAGFRRETDDISRPLLIDTHSCPVDEAVWRLYENVIGRTGRIPTLIEWDNDVPTWDELSSECARAEHLMNAIYSNSEVALDYAL